jgi:transposase
MCNLESVKTYEGTHDVHLLVLGEKITYRLAQRPGAYVILKYLRPVSNRKDTEGLSCPSAPPAVFEKSFADVSVLAGLLIDKFCYHLPLYRQHQRVRQAGIRLSRGTLTQWVQRAIELVEPIYYALLSLILQSQVLTMDETPVKAGRRVKGKLHTGYFWPLYGDQEEIAFPCAASRAQSVVREALGKLSKVSSLAHDPFRTMPRRVGSRTPSASFSNTSKTTIPTIP